MNGKYYFTTSSAEKAMVTVAIYSDSGVFVSICYSLCGHLQQSAVSFLSEISGVLIRQLETTSSFGLSV